ncbi:MAG: PAS domain-containing protein [Myxococcota bacterium]|nr:PAS domain-containing protein [Myxococcota bacterium]
MKSNRDLAAWLISQRNTIEAAMNERLGPAAPGVSSPEAEALRRFRTYVSTALMRDAVDPPALDGLRVNQRRTEALLLAWIETASDATPEPATVREQLAPLAQQFRSHLRSTSTSRKSRGTPRAKRRAVVAAIDRLAEGFLAIDTDTGIIEDANPAAGALLGLNRDELLGVDAMSFVPEAQKSELWRELDAVGEGVESHVFSTTLEDSRGAPLDLVVSSTRYAARNKTLALLLLRPAEALPAQAPIVTSPPPGSPTASA